MISLLSARTSLMRCDFRHHLAASAMLLVALAAGEARGAPAQEAVARCDALASHPKDPGRYAAGVTDEQFAPGAAIETCRAAVDANPELPRSWFQLGRAYWLAQRDELAVAAFSQAALRGYAPAMKFIGDAYAQGRGLPVGQKQSLEEAIAWYQKALDKGYREAQQAINETQQAIAMFRFDPSAFQNPAYMKRMYDGNFENISNPLEFLMYVGAFSEELGGRTIYMVDQRCQGMVTALSGTINSVQRILSFLQSAQDKDDAANAWLTLLFLSDGAKDQGMRDARILAQRYSCDSPIARKIVEHAIGSGQKLPAIINASLGKAKTGKRSDLPEEARVASLHKQKVVPLWWGAIAGRCGIENFPSSQNVCNRILALIKSKQHEVLICSYGPFKKDGTGFRGYYFWRNSVPQDLQSYNIRGEEHPFGMLGKTAVGECPANSRDVEPVFRTSRL